MTTRKIILAILLVILVWALCPKPNPGKPVPVDVEHVDVSIKRAQD